jgi:hypothetical protein
VTLLEGLISRGKSDESDLILGIVQRIIYVARQSSGQAVHGLFRIGDGGPRALKGRLRGYGRFVVRARLDDIHRVLGGVPVVARAAERDRILGVTQAWQEQGNANYFTVSSYLGTCVRAGNLDRGEIVVSRH